jgi:hypothetical protein
MKMIIRTDIEVCKHDPQGAAKGKKPVLPITPEGWLALYQGYETSKQLAKEIAATLAKIQASGAKHFAVVDMATAAAEQRHGARVLHNGGSYAILEDNARGEIQASHDARQALAKRRAQGE